VGYQTWAHCQKLIDTTWALAARAKVEDKAAVTTGKCPRWPPTTAWPGGAGKQDKEKLKKAAGERSQALKARLAGLRNKSKGLSGQEKAQADREIEDLAKKQEALDARLKDIDEATADKFDGLKKDLTSALEDTAKGADREEAPPK
jgi:hypothetical protein